MNYTKRTYRIRADQVSEVSKLSKRWQVSESGVIRELIDICTEPHLITTRRKDKMDMQVSLRRIK